MMIAVPKWPENLKPQAKALTPTEEDLYRKILNLEATVSNLKQTILNMDKEMQAIRTKTEVFKYDYVESIIKNSVNKIFNEESSNTKSPFEIKVLDY